MTLLSIPMGLLAATRMAIASVIRKRDGLSESYEALNIGLN